MAASSVPQPISSLQQTAGNPTLLQHAVSSATGQSGGGGSKIFPEEARIKALLSQLHRHLVQAQQLNLSQQQQQQPTAPASQQIISQAEEISKRLNKIVIRLQETVQDTSLVGLKERINAMATKLDLKFDMQRSQQSEISSLFLMCDAFYVEICCQDNGHVTSVKLAQANKQVDSDVLTQLVRSCKFDVLETHLHSLKDFYLQSSNGSDSSIMYRVLSSIESVLISITKMSPQNSLNKVILNNPLGHVIPRSAGLPMKLTFFVHPYEVLKYPSLFSSYPSDVAHQQHVDDQELGVSAKLLLEGSTNIYPLSIDPNLFDISKATFFRVTSQNSVNVSLNYVLHFSKNIPVSGAIRKELHNVVYTAEQYQPLRGPHINQLIAKEAADSKGIEVCTNKSYLVCLPSQRHYYYVPSELRSSNLSHDQGYPPAECGVMMSKINFIHPVHIFNLVTFLRKQLVYNTLVASILGRSPKGVPPPISSVEEFIFEVSTQPADNMITVVLDMQNESDYMGFDFVIPDQQPTSPVVKVKVGKDGTAVTNQQLSAIAERSMSIPITLYAVIKCPQFLEGGGAVKLFQNYMQTISDFNVELSNSGILKDDIGMAVEGVNLVDSYSTNIGIKRKRIG